MTHELLRKLARLGAEQELLDLRRKARALEQAFPGIKASLKKTILRANVAKARAAIKRKA